MAKLKRAVAVDGELNQCVVVDETPPGQGFGKAGHRLSKYFLIFPCTADCVPNRDTLVVFSIGFKSP